MHVLGVCLLRHSTTAKFNFVRCLMFSCSTCGTVDQTRVDVWQQDYRAFIFNPRRARVTVTLNIIHTTTDWVCYYNIQWICGWSYIGLPLHLPRSSSMPKNCLSYPYDHAMVADLRSMQMLNLYISQRSCVFNDRFIAHFRHRVSVIFFKSINDWWRRGQ